MHPPHAYIDAAIVDGVLVQDVINGVPPHWRDGASAERGSRWAGQVSSAYAMIGKVLHIVVVLVVCVLYLYIIYILSVWMERGAISVSSRVYARDVAHGCPVLPLGDYCRQQSGSWSPA